jgi:hypothetical protein
MKIGILYFCVERYEVFWRDFYESCEKFFVHDTEKHYFAFTDAKNIIGENKNSRVHKIYQESLGWPLMSLMRFEVFLTIKKELEQFDYLVFFNANLVFCRPISFETFFPTENMNLLACQHPNYYNKKSTEFPYSRDTKSTACIPIGEGKYYVQGALQGGKTEYFINAIEDMQKQVQTDLNNDVFAVWYDESHWNKYILNRTDIKVLTPSYLYPEGRRLPFTPIIKMLDKGRHFGFDYLRSKRNTPESDFKLFFKDNYRKIMVKFFKQNYYN